MKEPNKIAKYFMGSIGLIVLVLLVTSFSRRMAELRIISEQAEASNAQVTALVFTQEELKTQIAFAASDEAVEAWAYDEAYWIREGDHLISIVPLTKEELELPAINNISGAPSNENWEVWHSLFFD
ncbi:MAG: hypothetical protein ABFS03_05030 [Chloroflexota bacterium]